MIIVNVNINSVHNMHEVQFSFMGIFSKVIILFLYCLQQAAAQCAEMHGRKIALLFRPLQKQNVITALCFKYTNVDLQTANIVCELVV